MSELILAEKDKIEKEMIKATEKQAFDPVIQQQADDLVAELMAIDVKNLDLRENKTQAVAKLGEHVARKLAHQSTMLKQPMSKLMEDAEDGGPVAQNLISLQEQVNDVNPNRVDFSMGAMRRLLAKVPGMGTPISRWFARYQTVDGVVQDIINSLKRGRDQLQRDNVTLRGDQKNMRELTFSLQDYIQLGQLLDQQLTERTAQITEEQKKHFLEEEILFPLRQRILDLQQMLAVNQQGVLSVEVIVRNNHELIRGVDRAVNVTVTALSTASTLALALQAQKQVLKGVQAVTQTTNDLIADTANKLKTQGVAIQKQATETQLDIDTLKRAFSDVQAALDDISQFRRNALPKMAHSIVEMGGLTEKMEGSIRKMEGAETAKVALEDVIEIVEAKDNP